MRRLLLAGPLPLTKLLRAALTAACLTSVHAHAAASPEHKVEIVAPPELAKLLQANLDIVHWSARPDVTADQLAQLYLTAPEQIKTLLATEGYFSPSVESTLQETPLTWLAKFIVTPGEPTKVSSVQVDFSGAVMTDPDRDTRLAQARKAFTIKPGDVFRQSAWDEAKAATVKSLAASRYATAHVTASRAEIDPQAHTARLSVQIDSGPPVTFGSVRIKGQKRYPEKMIANLNPIHPGDPYSEEALLKYQRRLQATGRYASALVLAKADPSAPDNVPIDVTVVESQSRRVGFGIGYSTDSGLRGQINYTDHDFLNEKLKFTANASVDKLTQEAGVGLSWPNEPSGWHWGSGLKFKHEDIQGLDTMSYSVTGARIHATEDHETALSLQYLEEHQELEDGTKANNHALFLNQSWAFNRLDNVLAPREGYAVKLQLGGAAELLLSDQNFVRTTAKFQYLLPVFKFGTLLFRAEAGVVFAESTTGIPTDYLFRTGGDTTVRGYAFNSLGVEQGGSVVGGRYLGVASAEYIHWITKTWGAAIFYDIGNAADEVKLLKPLAAGYGVGVRWSSPVGALNLDIAHGTTAPEPWRIHFFAGINFQ